MDKEIRHGETLIDSLTSTPFSSAPSSPGRSSASNIGNGGYTNSAVVSAYFFSAPASPTHFLLSSSPAISAASAARAIDLGDSNFEFGLSARTMSTADELFINGQIRSGFASPDKDQDLIELNGPVHRRTRSVSPTRSPRFNWRERRKEASKAPKLESKWNSKSNSEAEPGKSVSTSASTSRSSSSSSTSSNPTNRSSKRWAFIKDLLLHRSKSEGSRSRNSVDQSRNSRSRNYKNGNNSTTNGSKEKFGNFGSFSPVLYKERAPSGQVGEMKRRTTFLPYRPGLLFGCLGFRRYGAINGFARNISSISSR